MGQLSQSVPKNSSNFAPSFRNEWRCVVLECIELSRRGAFPAIRESLGLGTQEALHQAEHKLFVKMKKTKKNATKVAKTDDNVKQLVETIKGQRQLKEKEQQLRKPATEQVEDYLCHNADGYKPNHRGRLPWGDEEIVVRRHRSYTWENFRMPKNINPETEAKLQDLFTQRLFRQQLLDNAKEAANMAQTQLRAARTNFRATEDTLAQLLPDSKCIHEEIEIVVP